MKYCSVRKSREKLRVGHGLNGLTLVITPIQDIDYHQVILLFSRSFGINHHSSFFVIKFVSTPKTNKTDRYDVSEILLKVVLNTMIIILILYRDDVKSKFRKRNIRSDQRRVGRYQRGNQNPYIEDWQKDKSTNNDLLQTLHRKLKIEQHKPH